MPFERPPELAESLVSSARRVTENGKEVPFGGITVPMPTYGQLVGGEGTQAQNTPVVEGVQPVRIEPEVGEI